MTRAFIGLAACLAAAALAACGDSGGDATGATPPTPSPAAPASDEADEAGGAFPVTVVSGAGDTATEVTIEAEPAAIVSLSPTATEMLFAVGAGDQVVAVDDQSDFPEGVPTTDLSGYEPNVEAVLGYAPDLVVASDDTGQLVSGLGAAGVPVLLLPAATTLDEAYGQIERVGAATGNVGGAAEVVAGMQADIDEIVSGLPERPEPLTYYHELDPTFYSVTGDTFIGAVYLQLGLTNIADGAGTGEQYPQLAQEYIVSSDPDVIFLADAECCGVTPEALAARPGWEGLSAVTAGRVYAVDEDVASRWGPRVVDFMRTVAGQVAELQPAA